MQQRQKKTALITGASRGIGKAIALTLARAGYHIFLNCSKSTTELREVQAEIEELSDGSCVCFVGDVGDATFVEEMFDSISESCGGLDVLVNNAGIAHIGLLSDMTDKEWNCLLQTNLSSVFYCCRAAIPAMVSKKQGKIVNISSMWGSVGASCEAAYSATKAGVHGLTRALAKELAPSNIQVNAIACGCIDTAMNAQLDAQERLVLETEIPAGRFGTPQEVADVVLQLLQSPAYLTGQIIGLDGGFL
ncbi:MAG: 3-oxoacyl-ACP reductase FabG [Faecalimonas sp.]|nr:3-oxoacyl-ACP reductase FabG [Faecalimonas sp.]